MSSGGAYLAAAYVVVLVTLLVYVGIIAAKLGRLRRQVAELPARDERPEERAAA